MNEKILVTLGTTNFDSLIDICDVKTDKYEFELTHVHNQIYVCIRFDSKKHYPYGDYSIPYSFTYMVEEELLKYDWPNISSSGLIVKNIGLPNGDTSTVIGI